MKSIVTYITVKTLVLCIFLLCTDQLYAQYNTNQNKNWSFGGLAGLNFSSGAPAVYTSAYNSLEGGATVSDASGNLLFYTDGKQVWNRAHTLMPSGASIVPYNTASTTQSAVIAPVINVPNKYYIFSLEQYSTPFKGRLAYSIVDMTLAGGMGDVVTSSMGTIIDSGMTEKMVVVSGDNCNLWLITHSIGGTDYFSYEITTTGISNTHIVSPVGLSTTAGVGTMKISPDRKTIAYAAGSIELVDFDPATGILSYCRTINSSGSFPYGLEFSPDNSKLYIKSAFNGIDQYDISLSSLGAIKASQTTISAAGGIGDMRLGPDNKIYICATGGLSTPIPGYMDRINNPNAAGTACGYVSSAINLSPNQHQTGITNVYWSEGVYTTKNATVCQGDTTRLMYSGSGTTSGIWVSSNTSVATVLTGLVTGVSAGTAVITYTARCGVTTTTVTVRPLPSAGTITGKTSLCVGDNVSLTNAVTGGGWISSNTGVATINSSGSLTAVAIGTSTISYTVTSSGCSNTTTTTATVAPAPNAGTITGSLSRVCVSASIKLTDITAGGVWSSSNTNVTVVSGTVTGVNAGTSTISYSITNACSTAVATKTITIAPSPGTISGVLSICGNVTTALSNSVPGGTWSSSNITIALVGSTGIVSGIAPGTTTISYSLSGCPSVAVVTVNVPPDTIAGPSAICVGLSDKLTNTISGGTWESSDTFSAKIDTNSGDIIAIAPGNVLITYTLLNSCSVTTTITILPLPDAGIIAGATTICPGTASILSSNVPDGVWSSSNTSSVTISGGIATGIALGTSTISYTVTTTCGSAVATTTLTVAPPPDAGFIFGPALVCRNAVFNLSDTITSGVWSSSNNVVATIGSSSGTVTALQDGTTTITYTITTPTRCKSTALYTVTVLAVVPYTITSDIARVQCNNNSDGNITVTVTGGSGNYEYMWANGVTGPKRVNIPAGLYTLLVKDISSQCYDSAAFVITQPEALLLAADVTNDLCKTNTGSIKLHVTGGTQPYSYLWSDNTTYDKLMSVPAGTYKITVTDWNNCIVSATTTITDSCDNVVIADVITPNGDGINDAWIIDGLQNYPNNLVQIFGKWGDLLYSKNNYNGDFKGAGNKGELLPDGTYIYLLKLDGANTRDETHVYKGTIMIKH